MIPAIIGAIIDLIGKGIGSKVSNDRAEVQANTAAKNTFILNEKAANNAYGRNVNFTNKYVTPNAQRRLLEQAGYSPAVFYDKGGVSGSGSISAQGGAQQSTPQIFDIGNAFGQMANSILLASQVKNLDADTKKKEKEAEKTDVDIDLTKTQNLLAKANVTKTEVETAGAEIQNSISKIEENWRDFMELENYTKLVAEINQIIKATNLLEEQTENLKIINKWTDKTQKANLNLIKAQAQKAQTDTELAKANIQLTNKQKDALYETIKGLQADNIIKQYQAANEAERQKLIIQELRENIRKIGTEADVRQMEMYINMADKAIGRALDFQKNIISVVEAVVPF